MPVIILSYGVLTGFIVNTFGSQRLTMSFAIPLIFSYFIFFILDKSVTGNILALCDSLFLFFSYKAAKDSHLNFVNALENKENAKQSYEKLVLAQKLAKIGSWSFDLNSQKIDWTPEMYTIFPEDITKGEPSFEEHKSTIFEDDVDEWETTVKNCINSGNSYKIHFRVVHPDKLIWVEAYGEAIKNSYGQVISLSGTCQDITERKNADEKLRSEKTRAELAAKSRSQFLASVSHEFRTPLNGINGIADIILNSKQISEPDLHDKLNVVKTCGNHLKELVNDILNFSKLDQDCLFLEYDWHNLNENLKNIENLFLGKFESKGLDLNIVNNLPKDLDLLIDKHALNQILLNLIGNAFKFTKVGSVEVFMDYLTYDPKIGIIPIDKSYPLSLGELYIRIKDTGIGISDSEKQKLFNPFVQANNTIHKNFGGTGLGLSIIDKIVSNFSGSIELASTPGEGSCFEISLPIFSNPIPIERFNLDEFEDIDTTNFPKQVLIVEDEKINQMIIGHYLDKLNVPYDLAEDGVKCIEVLNRNSEKHYDLILMDLKMPNMGGLETTSEIKNNSDYKNTIIWALTANVFSEDRQECFDVGMERVIEKPLSFKRLVSLFSNFYLDDCSGLQKSKNRFNEEVLFRLSSENNLSELYNFLLDEISSLEHKVNDNTLTPFDLNNIKLLVHPLGFVDATKVIRNLEKSYFESNQINWSLEIDKMYKELEDFQLFCKKNFGLILGPESNVNSA